MAPAGTTVVSVELALSTSFPSTYRIDRLLPKFGKIKRLFHALFPASYACFLPSCMVSARFPPSVAATTVLSLTNHPHPSSSPAKQAASVVALRFNRHHNLRRALGQVGFMTRGQPVALCPMLEQEVAGYNLLLQTLVVLSRGMDVDSGEPVEGGAGWPFAQVRAGHGWSRLGARERKAVEFLLQLFCWFSDPRHAA